jgi:two-component system phosphate regulon sensor histidine kinase PhoR
MTAVLGAAKTLMRDDIELTPERRRQLLEMIGAQGTRLTKIAEDVLIASRLDRDELRLERDHVDMAELVRTAVEHMREYVPETISLTARTSNGAPALGDRHRIEQVLVNLIDNAIKYSPNGGEVSVSTAALPHGVRVEVRDNGMGIPQAEQRSIFEKFYRLEGPQARAGTGLGLYICRELVQRMGGTIGVESDPGTGSTFYFELPRAA